MTNASTPTAQAGGRRARSIVLSLAWTAAALASLTIALGFSALIGGPARRGALVLADAPLPDAGLTFADAPDAGRFFDARDTVTVTVPWPMTVAEFLSVYHLENNLDARRALREQLGAASDADLLARDAEVTFHLTLRSAR